MRRNVSSVSKQFVKKASNLKCVKLSTEEELSKYLEISAYFLQYPQPEEFRGENF